LVFLSLSAEARQRGRQEFGRPDNDALKTSGLFFSHFALAVNHTASRRQAGGAAWPLAVSMISLSPHAKN
jgi:hypothetical protein